MLTDDIIDNIGSDVQIEMIIKPIFNFKAGEEPQVDNLLKNLNDKFRKMLYNIGR